MAGAASRRLSPCTRTARSSPIASSRWPSMARARCTHCGSINAMPKPLRCPRLWSARRLHRGIHVDRGSRPATSARRSTATSRAMAVAASAPTSSWPTTAVNAAALRSRRRPTARWWRCGAMCSSKVPPQRSSATTPSRQWQASLRRRFAPASTTGPSKPARTMAPGWRLRLAAATTRCGLATVPAKPWFATGGWVPMVRRSGKPGRCPTNRPSMPQCKAQARNW